MQLESAPSPLYGRLLTKLKRKQHTLLHSTMGLITRPRHQPNELKTIRHAVRVNLDYYWNTGALIVFPADFVESRI